MPWRYDERNDNERIKRIINNDSSNSSLPPSTDQKGKQPNTYNGRKKSDKECGGQKGHKGKTLTKKEVQSKISNGTFQHKVIPLGNQQGKYISKYILDFQIIPTATELRFYADNTGENCCSIRIQK